MINSLISGTVLVFIMYREIKITFYRLIINNSLNNKSRRLLFILVIYRRAASPTNRGERRCICMPGSVPKVSCAGCRIEPRGDTEASHAIIAGGILESGMLHRSTFGFVSGGSNEKLRIIDQ